jgi:hypothetical protein
MGAEARKIINLLYKGHQEFVLLFYCGNSAPTNEEL